jgi:hypothetical protein
LLNKQKSTLIMNIFRTNKRVVATVLKKEVAITLALALVFWAVGVPSLLQTAHASQVTGFSDVLSDSNLGSAAKHTIDFTNTSAIYGGQTLQISLDPVNTTPGSSAFTEIFSAASSSDFFLHSGATNYAIVSACTAGNQATVAANYNGGSDENVVFTVCGGATPIATSSAVSIVVGSTTPLWYNPSTTGSYVIRMRGGTTANTGDTRVAVLQNVTVTASVDTTFTFTVSGVATSTTYNGVTTTGSTTATVLPFATLVPGVKSSLAQTLNVTTNARNGFNVTVQENQPLTSSTGATIDLFKDGATTTTPIAWASPSNTLNVPSTYGHLGVTSDDSDLVGAANDFTSSKYAGNIDQPRTIFANNAPTNGTTQNIGLAHVLYSIEIGTLQEAGNDYTNTLTYVATPTF